MGDYSGAFPSTPGNYCGKQTRAERASPCNQPLFVTLDNTGNVWFTTPNNSMVARIAKLDTANNNQISEHLNPFVTSREPYAPPAHVGRERASLVDRRLGSCRQHARSTGGDIRRVRDERGRLHRRDRGCLAITSANIGMRSLLMHWGS